VDNRVLGIVMDSAGIKILIRDSDLKLVGEIDDYQSVTVIPRYDEVGSWTMQISAESSKVALVDPQQNPGGGIIAISPDKYQILSGPITHFGWSRNESNGEGVITVAGKSDDVVLQQRLVYPVPTSPIESQGATAFYTVSGEVTPLETLMHTIVDLNAGPGALTAREVPNLTLATDGGRGTNTDYRGLFRFDTVLEALKDIARASPTSLGAPIARGGLGFRIRQIPGNQLQFQVYETDNKVSAAKFSFELGNLENAEYTIDSPSVTNVILGAGRTAAFTNGPQVAANLYQYSRTDNWFPTFYAEAFSDVGEVDPTAGDAQEKLDTAADRVYDTGSGQVGLSITPIDTESLRYGRDWVEGDIVTVKVPYLTIQQQAREIVLTSDSSTLYKGNTAIGTEDGAYKRRTPGIYRRLSELSKLMQKKETQV
jgi:hypothetical protein